MREIARFVKKLRGLDHTGRWEFHPHLKYESVSQHSLWVAIFAGILAPAEDRNALVFAAVTHDFEESITADLPALVKAQTPNWHMVVEKAEAELFGGTVGAEERGIQDAFVAARYAAATSPVVKLADLFSALMYARMEQELGNTHFRRIECELIQSLVKLTKKPETNVEVGRRAILLLEALEFDYTSGVDRPDCISHL